MAAPDTARYFLVELIRASASRPVWNASESSFPEIRDRLDVPVEMIGGLPIAVMDRAQSARLMIDIADARRSSNQPALVFTSANGQVLSMCAQDRRARKLFM